MQSDQGLILCLTHALFILRALVLEPAEMEDTMDDHTVQLFGILIAKEVGMLRTVSRLMSMSPEITSPSLSSKVMISV